MRVYTPPLTVLLRSLQASFYLAGQALESWFEWRWEPQLMKISLEQLSPLRSIATGVFSLFWIVTLNAGSCDLATTAKNATLDDIKGFFESQKRDIVTFLGYSGSEYEDKATMLEIAGRILDEFDPSRIIVNIGGTPEGIGSVYELASPSLSVFSGIFRKIGHFSNFEKYILNTINKIKFLFSSK